MTTDVTTDVTPDNETESETEVIEPRPVHELLTLDTYQGMSDEEIQSLIDYYVRVKAHTLYNEYLASDLYTINEEQLTAAQQIAANANAVLDRILARHPEITNRGVSNE